jgi:hypothetical protein
MRLVRLDSIREELELARDIPSAALAAPVQAGVLILGHRAKAALCDDRHDGVVPGS